MNQFFTPYQRLNHTNVDPIYDDDWAMFFARFLMHIEVNKPYQTPAPKYLLEADYEYNPEWIE